VVGVKFAAAAVVTVVLQIDDGPAQAGVARTTRRQSSTGLVPENISSGGTGGGHLEDGRTRFGPVDALDAAAAPKSRATAARDDVVGRRRARPIGATAVKAGRKTGAGLPDGSGGRTQLRRRTGTASERSVPLDHPAVGDLID
jgi:hypothetical protein